MNNKHFSRRARRQRGAALLEALVAILIFSIGILGMVALDARSTQFAVNAEDRNRAALLADDIAAFMWTQRSVNVPAAQLAIWEAFVADATTGGLPDGELEIDVVAAGAGGQPRADITIRWRTPTDPAGSENRLTTQVVVVP